MPEAPVADVDDRENEELESPPMQPYPVWTGRWFASDSGRWEFAPAVYRDGVDFYPVVSSSQLGGGGPDSWGDPIESLEKAIQVATAMARSCADALVTDYARAARLARRDVTRFLSSDPGPDDDPKVNVGRVHVVWDSLVLNGSPGVFETWPVVFRREGEDGFYPGLGIREGWVCEEGTITSGEVIMQKVASIEEAIEVASVRARSRLQELELAGPGDGRLTWDAYKLEEFRQPRPWQAPQLVKFWRGFAVGESQCGITVWPAVFKQVGTGDEFRNKHLVPGVYLRDTEGTVVADVLPGVKNLEEAEGLARERAREIFEQRVHAEHSPVGDRPRERG